MSDGLMSIGHFSRASLLSIKTLRAYHEAGILVPAQVDPDTGYRAYHVSQLTDAAVVRRLRSLDLPLAQVREVVTASDPAITAKVLGEHTLAMQARLDEVTRVVTGLQETLDLPTVHTPVHIRTEPAAFALAVEGRVTEQDFPEFLGQAYAALGAAVDELGLTPGPSGALYPAEILDETPSDVVAYVPVPTPAPRAVGPAIPYELPSVGVAVGVHVGDYPTIGDTYRQVGAWVALNATAAPLPVREVYLVSYDQTNDPSRFRTEIQWPVA